MSVALRSVGAVASNGSPVFGASTTAGDLGIAWAFSNSGNSSMPFTIDQGWTIVPPTGAGAAFEWGCLAYKQNLGSGETAPTWLTGVGSSFATCLATFSGAAAAGGPMGTPVNAGAGGVSTQVATMGAPDSSPGGLIVYAGGWNGGASGAAITVTMADSNGSSVTPTVYDNSPFSSFGYVFAWGVAGGVVGSSGDTCTASIGAFSNGGCGIAVFAAAGGPPPASQPDLLISSFP